MNFYEESAHWWPLMSAPAEYEEEAGLYWQIISKYKTNIHNALELGSGGGNNASHLKKHCHWTLSDLSPGMLEVSKKLNPECEHVCADMRALNLGRTFDLVFIHDAISFLTTESDLLKVFQVAYQHLAPDGLLFVAPDFFAETFKPTTDCGGHDNEGKSLRYLEWVYDLDPTDTIVQVQYAYVFRDETGKVTCAHESALNGLFSMTTWENALNNAGFKAHFEEINHSELEPGSYFGIIGKK